MEKISHMVMPKDQTSDFSDHCCLVMTCRGKAGKEVRQQAAGSRPKAGVRQGCRPVRAR